MKKPSASDRPEIVLGALDGLQSFSFRGHYRSGADLLARDLLMPALERSHRYWRAAGFFSSSVFRSAAPAFSGFFGRGGTMRLVTGPLFEPGDIEGLRRYYIGREAAGGSVEEAFRRLSDRNETTGGIFGRLLQMGSLQVFVARPVDPTGNAIYHEKFAVFLDVNASLVVVGSGNESAMGWEKSFERFEVSRSWSGGLERIATHRILAQFEALTNNETSGLEVVPLLQAYRKGWLEQRMTDSSDEKGANPMVVRTTQPEVLVQAPFELFEHQKSAMKRWAAAGGKGLLEMATGSGKTVTALAIASRLHDALKSPLTIIIIAPFIHLVDQWMEVAASFGLSPIRCAEGRMIWQDELSTAIYAVNNGRRHVLSVAVTAATLQSQGFRDMIARLRSPILVIGDEVHNYGASKVAAALPSNAAYRLGLSATPEKWMDPEGTARIYGYFGKTVHTYSMADALRDKVLVPYRYHPLLVPLDNDEAEKYEEISAKLAKFGIQEGSADLSEGAKALLMRRARILASARSKIPVLAGLLQKRVEDTHMLIYCGDGRPESDGDEMPARQIDEVLGLLDGLGIVAASYTAATPPESRRRILRDFDDGRIQALVAIRCLDEGVDVPSTRTAFILSSSTNPRQFIQRRGRVLRRSARTGKRQAAIYDFFVVPVADTGQGRAISKLMQGVVRRQLDRVLEFSSLALNGPEARSDLLAWTKRHGLVGLWGT
ncbi:DEAD/DEAH box helicase family protein [Bradyrhizobium sp. USDA 4451]